ncbi:DNL zinc finger-domain-containing protein, partial [Dissophora ornata]
MLIGFTCTVCNNRSHKTMSKHAYEHGVVIIQCDHCKNRHLIADHLGWFRTGGVTVEDLVKERGETVQKLAKGYQLVKD